MVRTPAKVSQRASQQAPTRPHRGLRARRTAGAVPVHRAPFLQPNELIVLAGPVNKRKNMFYKRRILVLTDRPRLFYVDEEKVRGAGTRAHPRAFGAGDVCVAHVDAPRTLRPRRTRLRWAMAQNEVKGEIPWDKGMRPELKNTKQFLVHTVRGVRTMPAAPRRDWGPLTRRPRPAPPAADDGGGGCRARVRSSWRTFRGTPPNGWI